MDDNMTESTAEKYKVVMVGDPGVGKSILHSRFTSNSVLYSSYVPTIGVDYGVANVDLGDNSVVLNIWDTAGQERFHMLTARLYARYARGVVLVYDTTRRHTFTNVARWIELVEQCNAADDHIYYLLVGNKSDLTEGREVSTEEGREMADRHAMLFVETSALTGTNTTSAVHLLASEIHQNDKRQMSQSCSSYGNSFTTLQQSGTVSKNIPSQQERPSQWKRLSTISLHETPQDNFKQRCCGGDIAPRRKRDYSIY